MVGPKIGSGREIEDFGGRSGGEALVGTVSTVGSDGLGENGAVDAELGITDTR